MKKTLLLFLTFILIMGSSVIANAETETTVYVSIANDSLVVSYEKISVLDVDNDGSLTINDVLYLVHEKKFEGGAEKGYASSNGMYGLKIDKLWGVENGVSYGYYLNNSSAMSLTDVVKNGDYVYAFIYTDLVTYSDTYSYFNTQCTSVDAGKSIELTLSAAGYDESWNPVQLPVNNASITINGKKTDIKTDSNGKASLNFDEAGTYVVSAESDSQNLVPPVCIITVNETTEESEITTEPAKPGDAFVFAFIFIAVVSLSLLIALIKTRKSV